MKLDIFETDYLRSYDTATIKPFEERSILTTRGVEKDPWHGAFWCENDKLTSLAGAPSKILGNFHCGRNKIESLDGAPVFISGDFYCEDNLLRSLAGIHKIIKEIHGRALFSGNPIKSHVLGLLKIKDLRSIMLDIDGDVASADVQYIINKYLKGDRNLLTCQEELIDAGYEAYAQL